MEQNVDTIGPGPGGYTPYTDFGGTTKVSSSSSKTPCYSFGGKEISRSSVNITTAANPGPGAYEDDHPLSSLGRQPLSKAASNPHINFGKSTRDKEAKVFSGNPTQAMVVSPGPAVYDIKSTIGSDLPSFSFGPGDEIDMKAKSASKNNAAQTISAQTKPPGPGAYNQKSSIGGQAVSTKRTAPQFRVGTAQRSKIGRQYSGLKNVTVEHTDSPGFNYLREEDEGDKKQASSLSEQADSKKKSAPSFSFGRRSNVEVREHSVLCSAVLMVFLTCYHLASRHIPRVDSPPSYARADGFHLA